MNTNKERQEFMMGMVDGMLSANPDLAAIAGAAHARGMKQRKVKEALARAFLTAFLSAATEEKYTGDPNKDVADLFRKELSDEGQ